MDPIPPSGTPIDQLVQGALREWGLEHHCEGIPRPMPGGASTRSFFRLNLSGQTHVLMITPPPDPRLPQARQAMGIAPFLEVAALLRDHGVSVPAIRHSSSNLQALLVEDLGQTTLETYVQEHPERKEALYSQVVGDLAQATARLRDLPITSCVRKRSFDRDLLRWELDHFVDWALVGQGHQPTAQERRLFDDCATFLVESITDWPTGFVHRDFQSRNLMVQRDSEGVERVTWIDFQDAMLGCRTYDLVALLTDSYQTFDPAFVAEMQALYCRLRSFDVAEVRREFDLVTLQRKLKDAGRFVYFDKVLGNPAYLPFVRPTLITIDQALSRLSECGPLHKLDQLLAKLG